MQDRTYAIAFLLILAIICLGAYVAVTTVLFRPRVPTISLGTPTPPAPLEVTATPTLPLFPTPTSPPSLVTPVAPTPTPPPPATPTPSSSLTPTPEPTPMGPTPTPAPPTPVGGVLYQVLRVEGPYGGQGRYIRGIVYDAEGKPEPGVRVHAYTDADDLGIKISKSSPSDMGQYDFPVGSTPGFYHLVIVSEAGQPISPVCDVDYQGSGAIYVYWQRVR